MYAYIYKRKVLLLVLLLLICYYCIVIYLFTSVVYIFRRKLGIFSLFLTISKGRNKFAGNLNHLIIINNIYLLITCISLFTKLVFIVNKRMIFMGISLFEWANSSVTIKRINQCNIFWC